MATGSDYYYRYLISSSAGCAVYTNSARLTINIPMTTTPASGDYVWVGSSTTWATASNWLTHDGTSYSVAASAPTSSNRTIVSATNSCATAQPTLGASASVGDLIIESGSTLSLGSNNLTVNGNFTNNGTFNANTGTVTFTGTGNIGGSSSSTFNSAIINGSGITVTLGGNTTVQSTLTLTNGKVATGGNTLTIGSASTNGAISGGSTTSYIVAYDNSGTIGKVKQFVNLATNTQYAFPIGDATNYAPLTYTQTGGTVGSGAYLEVYTSGVKVPGMSASLTDHLKRYWEVTSSGMTSPTYSISYTYVDGDIQGSETNFYPLKKSGTTWYKPTGTSFTTGTTEGSGSLNAGTNTLTWTGLSTFSSFGGAGNSATPLPVQLLSFQANCIDNRVDLTWTTASEHNSNYFTLERSASGAGWEPFQTIGAAGNSTVLLDYAVSDYFPVRGTGYYRLRQVDFDGVQTIYDPVSTNCLEDITDQIRVYPNPYKDKFYIDLNEPELVGNATLIISDINGKAVYTKSIHVFDDHNTFIVDDLEVNPGVYLVKITNGTASSEIVKITAR